MSDPLAESDLAMAWAYILLERGRRAEGFDLIEQNLLVKVGDRSHGYRHLADSLLMFAEGGFVTNYEHADFPGMLRARRKIRMVARRSGAIWGLMLWHLLTAREMEARLRRSIADQRYFKTLEQARHHCEKAAYYSLRTGRLRYYGEATRSLSYFLSLQGKSAQARVLARRALLWMPPEAAEDRMVCLHNCVALAVDAQDLPDARRQLKELKRERPTDDLSADRAIFVALASSEVAMAEARWHDADRWLDRAAGYLSRLPADLWNHAHNVAATRNKVKRLKAVAERTPPEHRPQPPQRPVADEPTAADEVMEEIRTEGLVTSA